MERIDRIVESSEAAKMIDRARSLGLIWDFHKYVPFQLSDIGEVRQAIKDKLAQKLGMASEELVDFDIDPRPSGWKDPYGQVYEHEKKLVISSYYKNKTGTEIVKEGFSYAFARARDVTDNWGHEPPLVGLHNLNAHLPLDSRYRLEIGVHPEVKAIIQKGTKDIGHYLKQLIAT